MKSSHHSFLPNQLGLAATGSPIPRFLIAWGVALGLLFVACSPLGSAADEKTLDGRTIRCDVLVVGGSFGGCAAALGASGLDVWVIEDSPWIGGQVTSQGVSALDEHAHVESFGGTRRYAAFRDGVRARSGSRNPGGGWVSRLCFEPRVGLAELEAELEGTRTSVLRETRIQSVMMDGDRIASVVALQEGKNRIIFEPRFVLDASDLGDLYPLAGIEHKVGRDARSETKEPHAAENADPAILQSYTYPFVVEYRKNESHVIAKPKDYEANRAAQPYSLTLRTAAGTDSRFGFFAKLEGSAGPFWSYRKIGHDIAMINWPGNDYRGSSILDPDHGGAKDLSLGFLYWLQTECPRDDGGKGYPELLLRPDVLGTKDGLSMRAYVREGRRLVARTTIVEEDVTVGDGVRGRPYPDSIGLGWYPIDVHAASGEKHDSGGLALATKPFQIPLGALLPVRVTNVIAAGKAIGTTHVTNGCYRLHPVEWSIGEAAGELASFCVERDVSPARVREDATLLRAFQRRLLEHGLPIFWYVDLVDRKDPLFVAAQYLAVTDGKPSRAESLEFGVSPESRRAALERFDALMSDESHGTTGR